MQSNLKVAITGGIGSGKSTVSRLIAERGFSVISCDDVYKKLLTEKSFIEKLSSEFGDILNKEGRIDKAKLSALVFSDNNKLERLNALTHPLIMQRVFEQAEGKDVIFCEVPLLFESGLQGEFDKVIVVLRDIESRIQAVRERDKLSENDILKRIKRQIDYGNYDFTQYYVIHNDKNLSDLTAQITDILKKLGLI